MSGLGLEQFDRQELELLLEACVSAKLADESNMPKRVRGNAIRKLRKASARFMLEKGEEIAKVLLDRALQGDLSCAKFLISMTEKQIPGRLKERKPPVDPGPSLAHRLELEPQWPPELTEPEEQSYTWVDPDAPSCTSDLKRA